jgi:actin-related protein 5
MSAGAAAAAGDDDFSIVQLEPVAPLVIDGFDYSHENRFSDYASLARGAVCVLDNGAAQCKAGWAHERNPRMIFDAVTVKSKAKASDDDAAAAFVGNAVRHVLDASDFAGAVKSPFVDGILESQGRQELIFDHCFARLGVNADGAVPHRVVCSEPLAAPNRARQQLMELFFEVYEVPALALGPDAMFAFRHAAGPPDGVSVAIGHGATQIVPFVHSMPVRERMIRIDVGASHMVDTLQRMLLNSHPQHRPYITPPAAKQLLSRFAYVARDYRAALFALHNDVGTTINERVLLWQLPFAADVPVVAEPKSAEELALLDQRRKAASDRFRLQHAAKREKKVDTLQSRFTALSGIRASVQARAPGWRVLLRNNKVDFDGVSELADQRALDAELLVVGRELVRLGAMSNDAVTALDLCDPDTLTDAELYPLVGRPDAELSSLELSSKKRQLARRAGRNLSRQVQAEKAAREKERLARDAAILANLPAHVAGLRHQLQRVRDARAKRQRRVRTEGSSRQSEFQRRKLSKLATSIIDDQSRAGMRREAMFGANDSDWLDYGVHDDGAASENEKEEIEQLQTQLLQWDPTFADTLADDGLSLAEQARVKLGNERVRATEVLFDPPQCGVTSAGLVECLTSMLQRFSLDERCRMAGQVLLSGGFVPRGTEARIGDAIVQAMPIGTAVSVRTIPDPIIATWRGAAACGRDAAFEGYWTRAEFAEHGADVGRFREHTWSNLFVPTPPPPDKNAGDVEEDGAEDDDDEGGVGDRKRKREASPS